MKIISRARLKMGVRAGLSMFLPLFLLILLPAESADSPTPDLEKARIIDKVVCAKDTQFSYSLFIPSAYSGEKEWPVIICFDPRAQGRRPVEKLQAAAEAYGYIIAGSLDSKNGPVEANQKAAKAVWQDIRERFSIDRARIYAAGFSGGAEVAAQFAHYVETQAAGIISCGAGLPPGYEPRWVKPAAYYGIIGNWDFRFLDMARLEEPFGLTEVTHRILYFEGWHQWPSSEALGEAIEWLELMAMKSGLKGEDAGFIEAQYQKRLQAASDLENSGRAFSALHEYESLTLDFKSLVDISKAEDKVLALKSAGEIEKLEKDKRAAEENEKSAQVRVQHVFAAIDQPGPGQPTLRLIDVVRALDIDVWAEASVQKKNPFRRDAARRLLSLIAIMADQRGVRAKAIGNHRLAVVLFELAVRASAGHPMNPGELYNLACAYALSGQGKDALKSLRSAVDKGFDDIELLDGDKDLDSVRNSPQFAAIVEELKAGKRSP